jgi:hypothetical protein
VCFITKNRENILFFLLLGNELFVFFYVKKVQESLVRNRFCYTFALANKGKQLSLNEKMGIKFADKEKSCIFAKLF